MAIKTFSKQPGDRLDYVLQGADWLDGDTITSVSASFRSNDANVSIDACIHDGQNVTTWVSGGADGEQSQITLTISTAAGRIKEAEFRIRVIEE